MTRPFHQMIDCPNCGCRMTAETSFGRWLRNHPDLDSLQHKFHTTDIDYFIERIMEYEDDRRSRIIHCVMAVEVKTRMASPSKSQRDMLYQYHQLFRNRRNIPTDERDRQLGLNVVNVMSLYNNTKIPVRLFGAHLLQFSGLGPDDSEFIWWDHGRHKDPITADVLVKLLRFELDPDTLKPIDLRSHHNRSLSLLPSCQTA